MTPPQILAPQSQVFVPVRAVGAMILDNGGDPIGYMFTPGAAIMVAFLINTDAGLASPRP